MIYSVLLSLFVYHIFALLQKASKRATHFKKSDLRSIVAEILLVSGILPPSLVSILSSTILNLLETQDILS